ncbi:hypothetical protein [Leptolyngbya sp. NIES-2104]|uniref:hypothetical protein n=1 Tax=Leptolyngbya sp. NIES-2104 TaxID=1552121 RepID=UPI0006EC9CE0|nr:hypothetical protein [Leptolyngbya sp. NIES-2104]GAP93647.1 ATPase [Leptolyngbya sp. NIES-2104]
MARAQRTSRVLDKGQVQLLKFRSVDPKMDFGNDRSITTLAKQIEQLNTQLIDYNNTLAQVDAKKLRLDEMEKTMNDLMDQLMNGVCGKYGNDSREFEMAGGIRKSDRVRKSAQARSKTLTSVR